MELRAPASGPDAGRSFVVYTRRDIDRIEQLSRLTDDQRLQMKAVSAVLPFRVNNYVVEELIDWENIPDDPMFQLAFPQAGMLEAADLDRMVNLVRSDAPKAEIESAARDIQYRMNPHPAGQLDLNVPRDAGGNTVPGMQHKYRETVLFFPTAGQTCHTYCSYCFRWAQFVGLDDMKFAAKETNSLVHYLRQHPEVTSVLFTGGDPMVMRTQLLRKYIEPLLEVETLTSIRIGTKSVAWWPHRYVGDKDADDLLRLFEQIQQRDKHVALMAHYSHPRELETPVAEEAVRRITSTGAVVRCQAPLIRHVNDNADAWRDLWNKQMSLGAIPYYMFVERDTGARGYFEVPLAKALDIFNTAYRQITGLARTVRGPSMSCNPGKVLVDGIAEVGGQKVFVLKFLQARDPRWVGKMFFARYDDTAAWMDQLEPAFGEDEFFFEPALREMQVQGDARVWKRAPEQPALAL